MIPNTSRPLKLSVYSVPSGSNAKSLKGHPSPSSSRWHFACFVISESSVYFSPSMRMTLVYVAVSVCHSGLSIGDGGL